MKGRESNLYKLLKFFKDKPDGGATSKEVGQYLGVPHPEQAIIRGSQRIKTLINSGMLERGEQVENDGRNSHAKYHITEKGRQTLAAGFVKADKEVAPLGLT